MNTSERLLATVSADPLLAYSLLAAALLAVVSVGTGLARLDLVALFRPRMLLRIVGAVAAAFLLTVLATVVVPEGAAPPSAVAGTPAPGGLDQGTSSRAAAVPQGTAAAADLGTADSSTADAVAAGEAAGGTGPTPAARGPTPARRTAARPRRAGGRRRPGERRRDRGEPAGERRATGRARTRRDRRAAVGTSAGAATGTAASTTPGAPPGGAAEPEAAGPAPVLATSRSWWSRVLPGLARFPLYLVTLAYGPSIGVVTAALFAGFEASSLLPGWPEAILALELAVLGWLAIYPSPRQHRLAGPFNALLAFALAWGTGGLALLEARAGDVTAAGLWQLVRNDVPGVVASAVLLALIPPSAYRTLFPASRIAPRVERAVAARSLVLTVVEERPAREDVSLTRPEMPRALPRRPRQRTLDPLPPLPDEDD